MKLNSTTRLLAAKGGNELRAFVASLTDGQRRYVFNELPAVLMGWYNAAFASKLQLPDVVLAAHFGTQDLKKLVVSMSYIRQIFPIGIRGKIYRVTSIQELPRKPIVLFEGQAQFRALTSWTVNKNPVVKYRSSSQGAPDIVLCYELPSIKNVLFDYKSIGQFVDSMISDQSYYEKLYGRFPRNYYSEVKELQGIYAREREVALYMNPGQSISCTWREVKRTRKSSDDE
jgi:hypothetical protein